MLSIIPGYEYDIFISYRQKDNKRDGWVTEFINTLKDEIEATFKEDISIYFDENPHDGLGETHNVDDSLAKKLKCLIFIPIISKTYCDPNSFAWTNEFLAFNELASNDEYGLKVTLPNGNTASRVLPIRIHDISDEDKKLVEDEIGFLRSIDFVYQSAGVNRPLNPSDERDLNIHRTTYRDQINKVANAIQEITTGIKTAETTDEPESDKSETPTPKKIQLTSEIKQRNVLRTSLVYILTSLLLWKVGGVVGVPENILGLLPLVLVILFPISVLMAWLYERSPQGFIRTGSVASRDNPFADAQKKPLTSNTFIILLVTTVAALFLIYPQGGSDTRADEEEIDKSIAVLPFTNTRPNADTDYLGFAIANQIIGELDYNKNLTVRPSSAIRKFNQQVFEARMVADELKVNYVLTGSYLILGDIIRLDIELLDANNNKGIWRDRLEVDFKNAFDLQDMVAQKVVEGLDVQFSAQELSIIKQDVPSDPLSFEYYLRSLAYPLSVEGSVLALEMLKKSVALDSTYAPAYAELGFRTNMILVYGSVEDRHPVNPEIYYLKALSFNENQLVALAGLGARYVEIGRTSDAVATLRKAVKIKPNNAYSRFFLGYVYRYGGMIDESIQEMEIALSLDPANSRFRSLGISYMSIGNYKKALEAFALDEGTAWELGWGSILHYANGEFNEVKNLCQTINSMESSGVWPRNCHMLIAAIEGNFEESKHWANESENDNKDNQGKIIDAENSYFNAVFYSINQDREGTIRCMKNAVNNGYYNYPIMIQDPMLEFIRDDEEFKAILLLAREKHLAFKEQFF